MQSDLECTSSEYLKSYSTIKILCQLTYGNYIHVIIIKVEVDRNQTAYTVPSDLE